MTQTQNLSPLPQQPDQVGIVVRDMDRAVQYYTTVLGMGPFRRFEFALPDGVMRGKKVSLKLKLAFTTLGALELELIEAPPGDNIYREFLDAKGEGLHHLGYHVSDIDSHLARLKQKGVGILFSGKTERVSFAYMDTAEPGGVIFELIQRK